MHSEKDELTFKYAPKFNYNRYGSPAGELKIVIETPTIKLVNPKLYDITTWDIIYLDSKFDFDERMDFVSTHDRVVTMPYKVNMCDVRGEYSDL